MATALRPLAFAILLLFVVAAGTAAAAREGDECSAAAGCGPGLHCAACGDGGASICARATPVDPLTHVRTLIRRRRNGGFIQKGCCFI
jgi:hypothetical protein